MTGPCTQSVLPKIVADFNQSAFLFKKINSIDRSNDLILDYVTLRDLEIVKSFSGNDQNTLFYFMDETNTAMGSRLLRNWLISPSQDINKLEKRMQTLRVGNPLDKNTDIGAINSKEQLEKITSLVNEGVNDGGELFQIECDLPSSGYWFRPSLFTNVQPSYNIAREEIFGPVLTLSLIHI